MNKFTIDDCSESLPHLLADVRLWLDGYPAESAGVVVPIFNALEDVLACIGSLGATTPNELPVLLIDDASTDDALPAAVQELADRFGFYYVRKPQNSGFVKTINLAFAWFGERDVVIVNSDTLFPSNWYERLRQAAYARPKIATATPLTNHGTLATVPDWRTPSPDLVNGLTLPESDERIAASSLHLYPAVPTAVGHCTYFRRAALNEVGFFDPSFSPGYGEEVDFSQRAILAGFENVLADDLFIHHKHNRSFSQLGTQTTAKLQEAHHPLLAQRYPDYYTAVQLLRKSAESPYMRAITQGRAALLAGSGNPTKASTAVGAKSLLQQVIHAIEILRQDGVAGLKAEIEQYVRWRRINAS